MNPALHPSGRHWSSTLLALSARLREVGPTSSLGGEIASMFAAIGLSGREISALVAGGSLPALFVSRRQR